MSSATKFTGAQKAAILLLSFGEEISSEIFKTMTEFEIKRVGGAMSRLARLEQEVIDDVIAEFYIILQDNKKFFHGGNDFTKKVLAQAFKGGEGEELIESLALDSSASMESLQLIDPRALATFLRNEHPQTIALILAYCDPKKFGETIKLLPEALHSEIVLRVANLDAVSPEVIDEIDDVIRAEVQSTGNVGSRQLGGVNALSEMMNLFDKATAERLMESLEERDPELSERVRQLMFVFEDIAKIDERGIQELIKNVKSDKWMVALKTASESLSELVYKNMSERAAKMLKEDMEAMPAMKLSDVEAAQYEIVQIARKLEEEGKLVIALAGAATMV